MWHCTYRDRYVCAMPSRMPMRGCQPRMVCAAVQSQGHRGVMERTRYGVIGTGRFSAFPSNSAPKPATLRNHAGTYHARTGRPERAWYVPAWFLKVAGFGAELLGKALKRPVPITPYRVRSITPLWPCDCTAAHTILGWQPRIGIREGMAH